MSDAELPASVSGTGADGSGARSPVGRFIDTRVAGILSMLLLLGGGMLVASQLELRFVPELDDKRVTVRVPYPGASPQEVEETITRRVEERVLGMDGVRRVTSRASSEGGTVTVDVDPLADTEDVLEDVRAAVERIEFFPPQGADQPQIASIGDAVPAMMLVVASPALGVEALRAAADQVREDLLALPSVSGVSILRAPDREIVIEVSEEALREHDLTIRDVADRLRRASFDLTSGELRTEAGGLVMRVSDRRTHAEGFEDIALLARRSGALVLLSDVAEVREGFADDAAFSELDGVPALFLSVAVSADGPSELEISREVRDMMASYDPPPGTTVTIWDDRVRRTLVRFDFVRSAGILGLALVFVLLALVFDFRLAVWVTIGVPISFFGALLLFPAFDLSITFVSIYALIIVIGIVVDDAIVVGESIARHQEEGLRGAAAAIAGARQVFWPVFVGVATTVVAFMPLLFTHGVVGQLFQIVPIVVTLVLTMSLLEAFLILPSHLAPTGGWSRWPLTRVQAATRAWLEQFRDRTAVPVIGVAIRRPVATLAISVAIIAVAGILVATGVLRFGSVEPIDLGEVHAKVTFPAGTPVEVTEVAARQLAEAARQTNAQLEGSPIRSVATVVGFHLGHIGLTRHDAAPFGTHLAAVDLQLVDESERSVTVKEIERLWRRNIGEVPGAVALTTRTNQYDSAYDVELVLSHPDTDTLQRAVDDLSGAMADLPGTFAVGDSLDPGRRHFDLEVTAAGRAAGLTPRSVATQLRSRFFGAEVQRIQRGRDELKVMVRYPDDQRRDFAELTDERLTLSMGGEMPLLDAVRILETREFDTLMRVDGVPAATVGTRVDIAVATGQQTLARLWEQTVPVLKQRYPGLDVLDSGEVVSDQDNLELLSWTAPLALMVIYVMIAVQFRSYLQPLVVLAPMPLAAAGAVLVHSILGYDLNVISLFGIIAALGVVINDTLLLQDRCNVILRDGDVPAVAAISAAIRQRFRPIVLTTVTTVVALMPVIYLKSETTQDALVPFVLSLAGGLVVGGIAILFVVPAILLLAEGWGQWQRVGLEADTTASGSPSG